MAYESVILVDTNDNMIGTMEKIAAHRSATLHRAISVFIFNSKGHILLQKRAGHKYHSGGEWSNACCSHPRPGELPVDAALRRLEEEMGMQCILEHAFSFTYHVALENGLYEHEYDHVYIGTTDIVPIPNVQEVEGFVYLSPKEIERDLFQNPQVFTPWFKICFERVMEHFKRKENE
jgi:isopentenyl-diphosphate Delta-isomerase